jgi:transcriptional regulator with XRE-family HTH domain
MVQISDLHAQNLAKNVESLRKKQGLTQSALAKVAGVTRAAVTLIESGEANPTLEILLKVSSALRVSLDELVSSPRAECQHILAKDIPQDRRSRNGVLLRKLLPDHIHATEMDELSLEPGALMKGSPHVEGTKEYFTCVEGQILVGVLGQTYLLKKGDVLAFPGDKHHSYKNPGKRAARGVSVVFFNPIS